MTATIPRRWTVELDGIRWLPRMIDKARMRERGELGTYLLGHSPVDFALLTRLGVTTEEFAAIVNDAPGDDDVLAALRARGFDEARVRRWSESFPRRYRHYILMWDLDEGYRRPTTVQAVAIAAFRPFERPAMALLRFARRAP
ncbi:MAG TPA: DUF5069 domain-containing protein [Candidatus Elarobacter sp.]|jgi:hypothetical protein